VTINVCLKKKHVLVDPVILAV